MVPDDISAGTRIDPAARPAGNMRAAPSEAAFEAEVTRLQV